MERDSKLQKKKGETSVRDAAELESEVTRRDAAASEESTDSRPHEDHVDHIYTEETAQDPSL